MDNLQRARVSILVDGDDLDPPKITELLGESPQHGVRKGELFVASHGKPVEARTGKWRFGGDWESPVDVNRQIRDVLSALTDDLSAWREVTTLYHCYLSVSAYLPDWTGGITLEPQTLKLLAERNLATDFDLYAPAASDSDCADRQVPTSQTFTPGDLYEDVFYHPCLCVGVSDDHDEIWGISLLDGSYPRACSLANNGVRKLGVDEAWHLKQKT